MRNHLYTCLLIVFISLYTGSNAKTRSSFDQMLMSRDGSAKRKPSEETVDKEELNKSYLEIVGAISTGLEAAVSECKHQFRWDLWNCPLTATSVVKATTNNRAAKEVAFLQAITAAGVMYSVTKSCSRPDNKLCGCGEGGNFHYASGTGQPNSDISQAVKSHNERAGHKFVKRTMRTLCKCHGVTGSCQMRTCWKQLAGFREIGDKLKKRYKRIKDLRHMRGFMQYSNKVQHPRLTKISKQDLVHFQDSPNFCETDNSIGYLGTHGRECLRLEKGASGKNLTKFERQSCRRLCRDCGHRVGKHVQEETYDCDCEFKWCCSVDCKRCTRNVTRYYCK
ncbi:WNT8A-like protein [Mya arenaria]|uniref:Protein Wnt n=1 Tax=Mya arenaria TaxID=6604 RepID=A0ABY7DGM7_MYAAR|nr:WNT8A-like protein [Mya arenaria]